MSVVITHMVKLIKINSILSEQWAQRELGWKCRQMMTRKLYCVDKYQPSIHYGQTNDKGTSDTSTSDSEPLHKDVGHM